MAARHTTKKQNLPRAIALGGLLLMVGCGAATSGNGTQSRTCSKNPAVTTNKTGTGSTSSLTLGLTSSSSAQPAIGTGFIDISTKDKDNKPLSRRCTMSIRPIDANDTVVRIWTAGHCSYNPQTAEFRNSKFTLQVYLDGGYFSVPAVLNDGETMANFSKVFDQYLNNPLVSVAVPSEYLEQLKSQINNALPNSTSQVCLDEEVKFRSQLGSKAKNVACFNRNEMRGLKSTITVDAKTGPLLKKVLATLRDQENQVMGKFDFAFKKIINSYIIAHSSEQRRLADLRSISYLINKKFCSTPPAERPKDENGREESGYACMMRDTDGLLLKTLKLPSIVDELQKNLPPADFAIAKDIFDDESTELTALRKATRGCSDVSVNNLSIDQDLEKLTPCDMGNISNSFWRKFVDVGPQIDSSILSPAIFGLNLSSYFGFFTNSIPTSGSAASSPSRAKLFSLNTSSVLNFEYSGRLATKEEKKNNVFLINYDASKQQINPVKGASGSILSVFGLVPVGLLSTVDGQPTSGGAGVTPLPQVGDEEDSVVRSNAGC